LTVAGIFLRRNGYRLTASNADLVKIATGVAQSQFSLDEIAAWLRENSQPIR
jgi:prophage maintenance system killer protein